TASRSITAIRLPMSARSSWSHRPAGRVAALRKVVAVPLPDEPETLERQERVDPLDRPRMGRDQLGQPACSDHARVDSELASNPVDDAVDLTREAVDDPRLERRR